MKHKPKILYLDDEEVNLRLFKSTFRREFVTYTATTPKEALEILDKTEIDVVITDQRMPDMTGVEFLKEVNTRFANIPPSRLIISGYSPSEEIKTAYDEYKLYKFVSKPWKEDILRKIIFEALNFI